MALSKLSCLSLLLLILHGELASAQATFLSGRERGLAEVDGELWAVGATYKARFERGGVTVVPPLGVDAPRSLPLHLALDSIAIGAERVCEATGTSEPIRSELQGDLAVSYEHGADVVEHYAVRTEALEQSFTLRALPTARGELVLRMRIDTELVPRGDGGGLFFEGAPERGLRYGELTAIDALGRRASGEVRLASGALELVVAADFMATAEAPLLLDPTIGGAFNLHPGPGEIGDPDVTVGLVAGRYFAVYERRFSATDIDIYGQEFQTNGAFVGPTVIYEPSFTPVSQNPTVTVDFLEPPPFGSGVEAYVAVWQQGTSISSSQSVVARASIPTTGTLTASVTVGGGPGSHTNPDAAAVQFFGLGVQSKVVVVWQQGTEIRARYLSVLSSTAAPVLGSTIPVSTNLLDDQPVVMSHGGFNYSALVVWRRFFATPAPGDHDLVGAVLSNISESFEIPTVPVQTTIGPDEQHPRIATGQIAYARAPSSSTSDRDIFCVGYDPNDTAAPLPISAPLLVASGATNDDHAPALGGNLFAQFLAWIHDGPGFGNVANGVTLVNQSCTLPFLCTPAWQVCENSYAVASSLIGLGFADLEIAGAMAVYESIGFGVFAQPLGVPADVSVSLGGGCSGGGVSGKQCFAAVNSNLTHMLTAAAPSQPVFLVVGLERIDAGCGSCTLIPDPFSGFVIAAGTTSAAGEAKVPMTIPNSAALHGLGFIDQWAVVPGASPCPQLGVTLSDARQFTIQ